MNNTGFDEIYAQVVIDIFIISVNTKAFDLDIILFFNHDSPVNEDFAKV